MTRRTPVPVLVAGPDERSPNVEHIAGWDDLSTTLCGLVIDRDGYWPNRGRGSVMCDVCQRAWEAVLAAVGGGR